MGQRLISGNLPDCTQANCPTFHGFCPLKHKNYWSKINVLANFTSILLSYLFCLHT